MKNLMKNLLLKLMCILLVLFTASNKAYGVMMLGDFEKEDEIEKIWKERPVKWWLDDRCKPEISCLHVTKGRHSLKVFFSGSEEDTWPGLRIYFTETNRDWSKYEFLKMDVYNPEDKPIRLSLRIDGPSLENPEKMARVWLNFILKPNTMNNLEIPVSSLADRIDVSKVDFLMIYLDKPRVGHTLFFDNIRLEKKEEVNIRDEVKIPSDIAISRVTSPPRIDGILDDECWKQATKVTMFLDTYSGKPVSEQTIAYLGYDDENFYFAFVCQESQMNKLVANIKDRDGRVWEDDCIEIFIDPGLFPGRYYHFVVNSIGTQYDARIDNGIFFINWGTDWEARATLDKNAWYVEVRIPFYIFDFTAKTDFHWKINLCREEKAKGELSAIFPTFGGFHTPERFGILTGLKTDFKKYFYRIEEISFGEKIGSNNLSFVVNNETGAAHKLMVKLSLTTPSGKFISSQKSIYVKEGKNSVSLNYSLQEQGNHHLVFYLVDENKKVVYASPSYTIVVPPPLSFHFTIPSYGNAIFATQSIQTIEGKVYLNIEESLKNGSVLTILTNKDKKVLQKVKRYLKKGVDELEIKLSASSLSVGDYQIKVSLLNKEEEEVASIIVPLRKLAPSFNEVRIDENNNLVVNGKPFFPIGIFYPDDTDECYEELKEAGFNTVYITMLWNPMDYYKPVFERAARYGIWITADTRFLQKGLSQFRIDGKRLNEQVIREWVRAGKDFPNFLVWFIEDEPNIQYKEPPEELVRLHQIIKEEDPYHPTYINLYLPRYMANYVKACDITGFDWYPIYRRDLHGESTTPLSYYLSYTKEAISQVNNSKPIWVIASAIEIGRERDPWHRRDRLPNYRENRLVAYLSIIAGAKGFWWWCYQWPLSKISEHPEWYGIKSVAKELSLLSPIFLSPSSNKKVIFFPEDKDIHFLLKEYQNDFYLIIANSGKEKKEITFTLPWLTSKKINVVGEAREISFVNGVFKDIFEKYDVHIYTTTDLYPKIKLVSQVEAEEERLRKEENERNQRNIFTSFFFKESGISYRVSSQWSGNYYANKGFFNPSWATDGLKHTFWSDGTPNEYPDWWEVELDAPQEISKIVVYSNLNTYELQHWDEGKWVTLDRIENNTNSKVVHTFNPPVKITRLRIFITKANGPLFDKWNRKIQYSRIYEVEAYK